MTDASYDLERLISRHLDDECSLEQRRELNDRLQHDPAAAALFEDHRVLDREVKLALRSALDRSALRLRPVAGWERVTRAGALAVAACLAVMFWFSPGRDTAAPAERTSAQASSWFAAPPTPSDTLVERPPRFVRPQIRVDHPDTDWIVIPSDKPGEFLIVEVNRVTTRSVPVQKDF